MILGILVFGAFCFKGEIGVDKIVTAAFLLLQYSCRKILKDAHTLGQGLLIM